MSDYSGERVYDSEKIIGKTVVNCVLRGDLVFQRYDDGSFFYAEAVEDYLRHDLGISNELAIELGIASQEAIDRENEEKRLRKERSKILRREEYEKLKKEFEGQP